MTQSDLYSLAQTTIFILTKEIPPPNELWQDPYEAVAELALPEVAMPILARALVWHPRDRYLGVAEFRRALAQIQVENEKAKAPPNLWPLLLHRLVNVDRVDGMACWRRFLSH